MRENKLSDPARVTIEDVHWFISNPGIFVWDDDGQIAGFSAADPRNGGIWALFMDQAYERRGIGRALFERACAVLWEAGFTRMWLTTDPGTRAEAFYRAAGWQVAGRKGSELLFEATAAHQQPISLQCPRRVAGAKIIRDCDCDLSRGPAGTIMANNPREPSSCLTETAA